MRDPKPLTLAAMGTSLTARGAWLEALPAALESELARPVHVLNFARVGATSHWGLETVEQVLSARPDIVTVEFASNDAALHRRVSAAQSFDNMTRIVRRLHSATPQPCIYLMTMSPAIGLRGLVRPRLDHYFDMYVEIAQREGVCLIDHRPSWQALGRSELARGLPDGAHPTLEFSLSITLVNVVTAITRDVRD